MPPDPLSLPALARTASKTRAEPRRERNLRRRASAQHTAPSVSRTAPAARAPSVADRTAQARSSALILTGLCRGSSILRTNLRRVTKFCESSGGSLCVGDCVDGHSWSQAVPNPLETVEALTCMALDICVDRSFHSPPPTLPLDRCARWGGSSGLVRSLKHGPSTACGGKGP